MEAWFWLAFFSWLLLFVPLSLGGLVCLGRFFQLIHAGLNIARGRRGARRLVGPRLRQLARGSLLVVSMAVLWYDLGRFIARHHAFWD